MIREAGKFPDGPEVGFSWYWLIYVLGKGGCISFVSILHKLPKLLQRNQELNNLSYSEKTTVIQLLKKSPSFYKILNFVTVHNIPPLGPTLSQMNPVHNFPPYFCEIRYNIILSSTPLSFEWYVPFRFPTQNSVCNSRLSHLCYIPLPFHPLRFDHQNYVWWSM